MKKIYFTFICLVLTSIAFAQKVEWGLSLNSGLFSFQGASVERSSSINFNEESQKSYTNNPYGDKSGLGYGLSGFVKVVNTNHLIYGIDIGLESLNSQIQIEEVSGYGGSSNFNLSADGKTNLRYINLNTFPFIGYRLDFEKINVDVLSGLEVAFLMSSKEIGSAVTSDGTKYNTSLDRKTIGTDLRPAFRIAVAYHRYGVYAGYSYGLSNYKSGYIGGVNEVYSSLIRFGLTYNFK